MSESKVQVTIIYATNVESLMEAWQFVMEKLEEVGPDPTVKIEPFWELPMNGMDNPNPPRKFSVVVEGSEKQ